jgi:hypothetical protein
MRDPFGVVKQYVPQDWRTSDGKVLDAPKRLMKKLKLVRKIKK